MTLWQRITPLSRTPKTPYTELPPPVLPFRWVQGEHVAITGDTGSGKTTFANALMYGRRATIALRTKRDTSPMPGMLVRTDADIERWYSPEHDRTRFLLEPKREVRAREIYRALRRVERMGNWSVYIDEQWYVERMHPAIREQIEELLTQGRSQGITVLTGSQRPVNISRYCLSQASHIIAFRADGRDVQILRDVATREYAERVGQLKRYECAWFYRPERAIWVGKVQDIQPLARRR